VAGSTAGGCGLAGWVHVAGEKSIFSLFIMIVAIDVPDRQGEKHASSRDERQ
jgi:hypothetical protein